MNIFEKEIPKENTALWWLGQAGYMIKSNDISILIDPYLSDSVAKVNPLFSRAYPVPISPNDIKADIFIVTHDHLDHLDPETIEAYRYKDTTQFVAPRHAAKKLKSLGIKHINIIDHGDSANIHGVTINGIFALATEPGAIDTTGYAIISENNKSVYHTSDTAYCDLLLQTAPNVDVFLPCINGKYGNLDIAGAIKLTKAVNPKYVIPNHYDVMALNSENPESFKYFCENETDVKVVILKPLELFEW